MVEGAALNLYAAKMVRSVLQKCVASGVISAVSTPSSRKNHSVGLVYFSADTKSLDVRVATSFISFEQAQRNLDHELGAGSAEDLLQ